MNELTIELDSKAKKPLYEQIYDYIKSDIKSGRIPFNEKLPSARKLSAHLQVSRSTVDLAYEQLVSEGYIDSIPCRGYYVCQIEELYHLEPERIKAYQTQKSVQKQYAYDFSPNGIDLSSFPFNAWRKITKNTLIDDNKEIFQLGSSKGELPLRTTICDYLHQARGVNCIPEQIVVGAGNDYLLMLLSRILGTSHTIAMENPTYKQAYDVLQSLSYEINIINMDQCGMNVRELEKSDADITYVMPSHQFPLGVIMPLKRRMELLQWAKLQEGRYIIEDDYDSEFRYKGKPIPSLQGYDRNETVIYLGTFSKSIAPAIRVSYMVLPKKLLIKYKENGNFYASTVSRIDQSILNTFIRDGYFERHLNKMRAIYKSRHDILLNSLKSFQGIAKVYGDHAGLHLLMGFSNGLTEHELIRRAAEQGVKVYGLSNYDIQKLGSAGKATIILGYANLGEADIVEAVSRLEKSWL